MDHLSFFVFVMILMWILFWNMRYLILSLILNAMNSCIYQGCVIVTFYIYEELMETLYFVNFFCLSTEIFVGKVEVKNFLCRLLSASENENFLAFRFPFVIANFFCLWNWKIFINHSDSEVCRNILEFLAVSSFFLSISRYLVFSR